MDKKFIGLVLVFLLAFSLFSTLMVFNKPLSRLTRAKEEFFPSSENSLIFAWPLSVKADGEKTTTINVFVRNNKNLPISNKKVSVLSNLGQIKEVQSLTDKYGKATFVLVSKNKGTATLKAIVDNQVELKTTVSIKFE